MPPLCKHHKLPKTEVWFENQQRGGKLQRVGCIVCKAEAARVPPPPPKMMKAAPKRGWI